MIGTNAFGSQRTFRISTIYKCMDDIGREIADECSDCRKLLNTASRGACWITTKSHSNSSEYADS